MKIGYILNTYPSPSQSFIRREMRALERRGVAIQRFAMRPFDGDLPDPADRDEKKSTEYVLARGLQAMLWALFVVGLQSPMRVYRALFLALKASRGSEAGLFKHLVYYLEAAYVTRRLTELGIDRMHAHFGTNSATVAMLAAEMSGKPFSFTVHGPEEFDKPAAIALPLKLQKADFIVAISSFGRSQLCRLVDYRIWPRIRVVHCGIEPQHYDAARPYPTTRPMKLVNIGRFVEHFQGELQLLFGRHRWSHRKPEPNSRQYRNDDDRAENQLADFRSEKALFGRIRSVQSGFIQRQFLGNGRRSRCGRSWFEGCCHE